jgi:hypothetical protein
MATRQNEARAVADAIDGSGNVLIETNRVAKALDKVFYGGQYEKKLNEFAIKVLLAFETTKSKAFTSGKFDIDNDGKYSTGESKAFADFVNNEMMFNFTDQSSLGPYDGDVKVPKMSESEAILYLNNIFDIKKIESPMPKTDE